MSDNTASATPAPAARFTAACIQHCAGDDAAANVATLIGLIGEASAAGADFVALPEACDFLCGDSQRMRDYAQSAEKHQALHSLAACAAQHKLWLLIGSLTMKNETGDMVNRSLLVDPAGEVVNHYDKIHMFDASVPGMKVTRESDIYRPGERACVHDLPWGRLGLSICYDLRFPHLYRSLAHSGARLLAVPSAFMRPTGEAHWHALLRSRAIENGCFVFAPAQWGNPYGKRLSYGHSLIVDPWGRVLADAQEGDGMALAEIDMSRVDESRAAISSLQHDRPFTPAPAGQSN